jgi:hypothetical protein
LNNDWVPLIPEFKAPNIQDVYVNNQGLNIEIFGNKKLKVLFPGFRSYQVSYERDVRDILPNINHPISVTSSSDWITRYKELVPEYKDIELVHAIVLDLAFVVEVIATSPPTIEFLQEDV